MNTALESILNVPYDVLLSNGTENNPRYTKDYHFNHGKLTLTAYMGTDETILDAARASFGQSHYLDIVRNENLMRRLINDGHYGVLEHCVLSFCFENMPLFAFNQAARYRLAHRADSNDVHWDSTYERQISLNVASYRYIDPTDAPINYYIPVDVRAQSNNNKQASDGLVDQSLALQFQDDLRKFSELGLELQRKYAEAGVAKELARSFQTVNTNTRFVMTANLNVFRNFCEQRCDSHAQFEIRAFAVGVRDIIRNGFPMFYGAWKNKAGWND